MVPMNKNTIATISILAFIAQWNAFLWPSLVTQTDATRLVSLRSDRLPLGSKLRYPVPHGGLLYHPASHGGLYIVFRKRIMDGVAGGGIKG